MLSFGCPKVTTINGFYCIWLVFLQCIYHIRYNRTVSWFPKPLFFPIFMAPSLIYCPHLFFCLWCCWKVVKKCRITVITQITSRLLGRFFIESLVLAYQFVTNKMDIKFCSQKKDFFSLLTRVSPIKKTTNYWKHFYVEDKY